eukprot:2121680-Rhodomonas_salina.1
MASKPQTSARTYQHKQPFENPHRLEAHAPGLQAGLCCAAARSASKPETSSILSSDARPFPAQRPPCATRTAVRSYHALAVRCSALTRTPKSETRNYKRATELAEIVV